MVLMGDQLFTPSFYTLLKFLPPLSRAGLIDSKT